MYFTPLKRFWAIALALTTLCHVQAQGRDLLWSAGAEVAAGSGDFVPSYIMANRYGTLTQSKSGLVHAAVTLPTDSTKFFSVGAGLELWGGAMSKTTYGRYSTEAGQLLPNPQKPANFWVQQLYADLKVGIVTFSLGQWQRQTMLVDHELSSGELIFSNNTRPLPGIEVKTNGFINIPGTKGIFAVRAELGYYKALENKWVRNHYNYYGEHMGTDWYYNHKFLAFKFRFSKQVSFQIGFQADCQFGGTINNYEQGELKSVIHNTVTFKTLLHTLFPNGGGTTWSEQVNLEGNHLGTWNLGLDYAPRTDLRFRAYYQSPWEDGSSIGKFNGFDGLYGIMLRTGKSSGIVTGAAIEYLDLTNQSGPLHNEPYASAEGTILAKHRAGGNDDYYNNFAYNSYTYLGQLMGSALVKSPIYNTEGQLWITDNRIRAFHAAVTGYFVPEQFSYKLMGKYVRSWGKYSVPARSVRNLYSLLLQLNYAPAKCKGLNIRAQFSFDRGDLIPQTMGATLAVSYTGNLSLNRK